MDGRMHGQHMHGCTVLQNNNKTKFQTPRLPVYEDLAELHALAAPVEACSLDEPRLINALSAHNLVIHIKLTCARGSCLA
jgi:hypothetical protein